MSENEVPASAAVAPHRACVAAADAPLGVIAGAAATAPAAPGLRPALFLGHPHQPDALLQHRREPAGDGERDVRGGCAVQGDLLQAGRIRSLRQCRSGKV